MLVPSGPEILLVLALLAVLVLIVVAMVSAHRRDSPKHLPVLAEVADRSTGVLACPVCRGASFQSPPGGRGGFFALALGPFVFGSMTSTGLDVVQCVTCGTRFARGLYLPAESPVSAS
jgi:hypothetical protein